jgi:hypothetical protein
MLDNSGMPCRCALGSARHGSNNTGNDSVTTQDQARHTQSHDARTALVRAPFTPAQVVQLVVLQHRQRVDLAAGVKHYIRVAPQRSNLVPNVAPHIVKPGARVKRLLHHFLHRGRNTSLRHGTHGTRGFTQR